MLQRQVELPQSPPMSAPASTFAPLLALTLAAVGCGRGYDGPPRVAVVPVTGKVLFQGRPAANAFVIFHPKSPQGDVPSPRSVADAEGRFAVTTYDHADGAPEGEYVVTVELKKLVQKDGEAKAGPNVLPPKYQSKGTSTLLVRVAKGAGEIPLEIK